MCHGWGEGMDDRHIHNELPAGQWQQRVASLLSPGLFQHHYVGRADNAGLPSAPGGGQAHEQWTAVQRAADTIVADVDLPFTQRLAGQKVPGLLRMVRRWSLYRGQMTGSASAPGMGRRANLKRVASGI